MKGMELHKFVNIRVVINSKDYGREKYQGKFVYFIKFDRDLIQKIETDTFELVSTSMNTAVTQISNMVSRHPENFFKSIYITW